MTASTRKTARHGPNETLVQMGDGHDHKSVPQGMSASAPPELPGAPPIDKGKAKETKSPKKKVTDMAFALEVESDTKTSPKAKAPSSSRSGQDVPAKKSTNSKKVAPGTIREGLPTKAKQAPSDTDINPKHTPKKPVCRVTVKDESPEMNIYDEPTMPTSPNQLLEKTVIFLSDEGDDCHPDFKSELKKLEYMVSNEWPRLLKEKKEGWENLDLSILRRGKAMLRTQRHKVSDKNRLWFEKSLFPQYSPAPSVASHDYPPPAKEPKLFGRMNATRSKLPKQKGAHKPKDVDEVPATSSKSALKTKATEAKVLGRGGPTGPDVSEKTKISEPKSLGSLKGNATLVTGAGLPDQGGATEPDISRKTKTPEPKSLGTLKGNATLLTGAGLSGQRGPTGFEGSVQTKATGSEVVGNEKGAKSKVLDDERPRGPSSEEEETSEEEEMSPASKEKYSKNPWWEEMPRPEIWHRKMPNTYPWGDTPYWVRQKSDEIKRDLGEGMNQHM